MQTGLSLTTPSSSSASFKPPRIESSLPFADPSKARRWFAEGSNHDVGEFAQEFRVGGTGRAIMRLRSGPLGGTAFTNHSIYLDIVPNRRVVAASTMTMGDRRISASLTTFEIAKH